MAGAFLADIYHARLNVFGFKLETQFMRFYANPTNKSKLKVKKNFEFCFKYKKKKDAEFLFYFFFKKKREEKKKKKWVFDL